MEGGLCVHNKYIGKYNQFEGFYLDKCRAYPLNDTILYQEQLDGIYLFRIVV